MTRKQATLLLLGAPAAAFQAERASKQQIGNYTTGTVKIVQPPKTESMVVALVDKDTDEEGYWLGIDCFEIRYKGETKRITAAEIWEALK